MRITKHIILLSALALAFISGCSKGDPELEVSPSELDFGTTQTQKQVSIKNVGDDGGLLKSGVEPLDYELDPNASWISVSPSSGRCEKDETDQITVSINRDAMPTGDNTGNISISSNGGGQSVSVSATKTPPSLLCVSPATWTAPAGGGTKSISVTNCGNSSTLSWTASESYSWISLSRTSGSTSGSFTITTTANNSGSTRTGTITVSSPGLSSKTVTVTQPSSSAKLCVSPSSWTSPSGGGTSSSISVTNCGNSSTLSWTAYESYSWISLSRTSGSTPSSFTITTTANNSGSTRTGTITVSASGVSSKTITVTQSSYETINLICARRGYSTSTGWTSQTANIEVGYEDNIWPVNDIMNRGFTWFNIPSWIRNSTIVEAYITVDVQDISIWNDLLDQVRLMHLGTLTWGEFAALPSTARFDALVGSYVSYQRKATTLTFNISSSLFYLLMQDETGFSFRAYPEDPSGSSGNDTHRITLNNPILHVKYH